MLLRTLRRPAELAAALPPRLCGAMPRFTQARKHFDGRKDLHLMACKSKGRVMVCFEELTAGQAGHGCATAMARAAKAASALAFSEIEFAA